MIVSPIFTILARGKWKNLFFSRQICFLYKAQQFQPKRVTGYGFPKTNVQHRQHDGRFSEKGEIPSDYYRVRDDRSGGGQYSVRGEMRHHGGR
jgi:hypothetical protein